MNKNQRIVHGQRASNKTYSTININFHVCRVSQPVSSTNYGFTLIKLRVTSTKVTEVLTEIAPKMQATMTVINKMSEQKNETL